MTGEPVGARERLTTMLGRLVAATSTKALASETGTTDRTDAIAMVMGWLQGDIADIEAAAARAEAPRLTVEALALALLRDHERLTGRRRWEWSDMEDFERDYWLGQAKRIFDLAPDAR